LCGNVDFDNKYNELDGTLVCTKCNKKLKAIGVDYSKPGYFYKCLESKSLLPDIERDYICLKCGESSIEYELDLLQLHAFTINREKLAEVLNHPSRTQSLVEQLNKVGIKSTLSGSIVGVSQIRHTFDLVVYNEKNAPTLVMDVIEPDQSDQNKEENHLLSFIAKCIDANISSKVILAIPNLKRNLKSLINLNGGIVIESLTKDDAISEVVATVSQLLGVEKIN
jgi:hypothetical protein